VEFREYTSMKFKAESFWKTNPQKWWATQGSNFPTWERIAADVLDIIVVDKNLTSRYLGRYFPRYLDKSRKILGSY
jgi:hypothetical protein